MDHDTTPSYLMALAIVFTIISPIAVGLRLYARYSRREKFGMDDWLVIPALLTLLGAAVVIFIGVGDRVFGYPMPTLPDGEDNFTTQNIVWTAVSQLQWAFFLLQIPCRGFVKLSYVFFFRRIFVAGKTSFDTASMLSAVIVVLWTLAFFLWFLFACAGNFADRWNTIDSYYKQCPTAIESFVALDISDSLTDLLVLLLPIPMVVRLNMRISRKLSVLGIFSLGTAALAASIARLAIFAPLIPLFSPGNPKHSTLDFNLLVTKGVYWSILESGLGLMSCCLPTLNAFYLDVRAHRHLKAFKAERKGSSIKNRSRSPTDVTERDSSEHLDALKARLESHDCIPGLMPAIIAPGVETKRHLIESYMS